MDSTQVTITYIGGPTALIEFGGVRLVTDPTFDPAPAEYPSGAATLRKLTGPALTSDQLGSVDYVLLSHDHHYDNLDHKGREFLSRVGKVFTTTEAAQRLRGSSVGLKAWEAQKHKLPAGRRSRW